MSVYFSGAHFDSGSTFVVLISNGSRSMDWPKMSAHVGLSGGLHGPNFLDHSRVSFNRPVKPYYYTGLSPNSTFQNFKFGLRYFRIRFFFYPRLPRCIRQ